MCLIFRPCALRATFVLPKLKEFEITKEFTIFTLKLIEKVAAYSSSISPKLQTELNTLRSEFEASRESNKDKKDEVSDRLRKQKEEKWAKMTPMERQKAQELEKKRAMKARGGVRKVKMG